MVIFRNIPIFGIALMCLSPALSLSQNYPTKPIRMVTGEVGGGNDFASRLIAPKLSVVLGQQVVVENRGGSAIFPAQAVSKAPVDGYTLLFYGNPLWILPLLQKNAPYDAVADFVPITLTSISANMLVVHPSLPAKSVKELIALAKARAGELNYASGGTGASNHLAAELFNFMAGVKTVRIAYKGSGPAYNALIAGEVQIMFPAGGSVTEYVKAGRLRALGITSAEPSPLFPGIPSVSAAGLPGYESVLMLGVFAGTKTPEAIVNRLNQEVNRVLADPDVKQRFFNAGFDIVGGSAEVLASKIKGDIARMDKVIKSAGIHVE